MTERSDTGTERQVVCPFVAYDDDRDYRSEVPDHRQRCFAERPPASRALAHQAAYCLSSSFPGCPTFMDWARREAAPPKEQPIRTLREAPTAPRQAERSGASASRPVQPQAAPATPPRQRRAEWTAPPPWAADDGAAAPGGQVRDAGDDADGDSVPVPDVAPPDDEVDVGPGFGAWSGSALGRLAASEGPVVDEPARPLETTAGVDREPGFAQPEPDAPAFLAGRALRLRDAEGTQVEPTDPAVSRPAPRPVPPRRGAVGYTPGDPARSRVPGRGRDRAVEHAPDRAADRGADRDVADPSAPSWERPRRFEAYPSLKSSGGGLAALPRPALYGLIILVVAIALFATPFVLRGLTSGDGGAAASPTPAASASPGTSAVPSATPVPSPSPTVYTVKAGDTLSRIAAKYGVTVDQIVKANPQIKDPNKLGLGDQIVIPPVVAPAITDNGTLTPAPSTAAP